MPYGLRDNRLVHVDDLTEDEHGAAARCVCPECLGTVLARWGPVVRRHFSHTSNNCTPSVMSLVHRFAQEFIARQPHVDLPSYTTYVGANVRGRDYSKKLEYPAARMQIREASLEKTMGARLRPDVWLVAPEGQVESNCDHLAVEVYFRHAVDAEKRDDIATTHLSWVEFDISDLDAECVNATEMARAVGQLHRWHWLQRSGTRSAQFNFEQDMQWHASAFVPARPSTVPTVQRSKPFRKLQEAERQLSWAETLLRQRRTQKRTEADNIAWFASLTEIQRLAVCGALTGLPLEWMPQHFYQVVAGPRPSGIKSHGWAWQLPLWSKFAHKERDFTSLEAAGWLHAVLGDRQERNEYASTNGYTRLAGTVHNFLLNLTAQGLLVSDPNVRPAERKFRRAPDAAAKLDRAVELSVADGN
ncbi:hypothetical protein [Paraburkholderia sp. C35]|uniref:competence protein CoiA family protein n=1 Tax=Paraburkholderia sp. C35 TaxID=2126993 RepID=UPI0013A57B2A|nr:hypothetical protein [Paraburkholderia sp. C35]